MTSPGVDHLELDEYQRSCAISGARTVWCIASPGSGKTSTLAAAVVHRIRSGIHPSKIMAITFTRLAAEEMKERISESHEDGSRVKVGTFHSICYEIVCANWKELGYSSSKIAIYDQVEQTQLLKETISCSRHSASHKAVIRLLELYDEEELCPGPNAPVHSIASLYLSALRQHQAVDYALIPRLALSVLRRSNFSRWTNVFVDEAHDVGLQEIEFIQLINPDGLFVVSDLKQSIYSWRGARPDLLPQFMLGRSGVDTHILTRNYRSGREVVSAANKIIPFLVGPHDVPAEAHLMKSAVPLDDDEGYVSYTPEEDLADTIRLFGEMGSVGVLARTHQVLVGISNELEAKGIAHSLIGRFARLLDNPNIRDILAYIAWPSWPSNLSYMKRVLRAERLSDLAIAEVHAEARRSGAPPLEAALSRLEGLRSLYVDDIELCSMPLTEQVALVIARTFEVSGGIGAQTVSEFLQLVSLFIRRSTWEERTAANFISWLALRDPQDGVERSGVEVMTIHASKGLEFDTVVMAGLSDDVLPDRRNHEGESLQEERRLFFVGMTRARQRLILVRDRNQSRFVGEIT